MGRSIGGGAGEGLKGRRRRAITLPGVPGKARRADGGAQNVWAFGTVIQKSKQLSIMVKQIGTFRAKKRQVPHSAAGGERRNQLSSPTPRAAVNRLVGIVSHLRLKRAITE
jgi:hypothetical protein